MVKGKEPVRSMFSLSLRRRENASAGMIICITNSWKTFFCLESRVALYTVYET